MRQSAKETRTRTEPLLLPGNLYESLHLARSAAEYVANDSGTPGFGQREEESSSAILNVYTGI